MKLPGLSGSFWPTPAQGSLLRAALLPTGGAAVWTGARNDIDVDRLPGELHRLLPLLSRALTEAGIDDPDLDRLRGVRQFTWYRNQRLFTDAAAAVAALVDHGMQPILLRGAASALHSYADVGLRPMNDVDFLVPEAAALQAKRLLGDLGWSAVAQSRARRQFEGAFTVVNGEGRRIVVHWRPSRNLPEDRPWWATGPAVRFGSVDIETLDFNAHLVQVIVDGARALSGSNLRWIADATMCLRVHEPDWDELADTAGLLGAGPLVGDALSYLKEFLDVSIPERAVVAMRTRTPPSWRRKAAHRLSGTEVHRLGRMPELLGRFLRLTDGDPALRAAAEFPFFLQGALGVESASSMPAAVARKSLAALAGRGPEADRGPESSRP